MGDRALGHRADGTSAGYDLLVGADGIRSRVRELAFDGQIAPDYTRVVVWRALLDRPPEVDHFHLYNAPRATCGLCPVSDAQMYMFAVQPLPGFDRVPAEDEPALGRARCHGGGTRIASTGRRTTWPGFDVAAFERRVWAELATPY